MTDYFELFGFERKAVLDADAVRLRFQELSRDLHPDADGGDAERFAELNDGQAVLSRTTSRLRHLVALDFGREAAEGLKEGAMGEALVTLFGEVGEVIAKADAFLAKRAKVESAVAKALLAAEETAVQMALAEAGGKVSAFRKSVEEGLAEIDRQPQLSMAGELFRNLSFAEKWQGQLQERMGAMMG